MSSTYNRKNACPLLDRLQSCAHGCAASKVKRPGVSAPGKYIQITVALVLGALHDGIQLLDFRDYFWVLLGKVATKLDQDLDRFGTPAVRNEPSGATC